MAAAGPHPHPSSTWGARLPKLLFIAALLVVLLTVFLLSWHSMGGLDVWLHHQVGQDILSGQGFPRVNTYSYTEPEHSWTNHEWLFQVLVALVGPDQGAPLDPGIHRWNLLRTALSVLFMATLLMGDGAFRKILRPRGPGWGAAWLALPLLWGLLLLWPRLLLRPELLSYLFIVLLVQAVDQLSAPVNPAGQWRNLVDPRRPLGRAFWLTVLWSQFHGFSSLGPVVMLLAVLAHHLERFLWRVKPPAGQTPGALVLLSVPLLLAALCLTPNGIQGLLYPLRALGQFRGAGVDLRSTISELVPLLETRDSLGWTLSAFKLSLVWGLIWIVLTWSRTSLLRIMLWAAAAWAAYLGQRNIGIYAVAFMLLHTGTTGAPVWGRIPAPWRKIPGRLLGPVGLALALLWAVPWWLQITGDDFYLGEGVSRRFGPGANPGRYPEQTAQILAADPPVRLFTNVDAAAFLLDRTDARLFIDGRTEAYSPEIWAKYAGIKRGDEKALALLENSRPQRAFISAAGGSFHPLARSLLQSPRWQLIHQDETGFFFKPRDPSAGLSGPAPPASLEGLLPNPGTRLTPSRAADLCLAWALVMDVSDHPRLQEQALNRGLAFRPDHPQLQHNLGVLLLARKDNARALALFEGALRVNPRLAGSALNAGVCHLRLGAADQAKDLFARAARINPLSFQAWANLSIACQALDDRAGALQALEKAAAIQPGNQRILNMLRQLRSQG